MQSLFRSLGLGPPVKSKARPHDDDFTKQVETKLDLRRPASRRVMTGPDLLNFNAGPAYALAPLDENSEIDDKRTIISPMSMHSLHNQSMASIGMKEHADDDEDEGALVYIVPSLRDSKRISKRHGHVDPDGDARRSRVLSSASSVRSIIEASFSMANSAPKSMLPAFVLSMDGCVIGRQPDENEKRSARDVCQDEIDFDAKDDGVLFGVFDGHGPDGHPAAALCASDLVSVVRDEQDYLLKEGKYEEALAQSMVALQRRLEETPPHRVDIDESGTTATIVYATAKNVYLANVGDSRAIAGRKRADGTYIVVDLSFDHLCSVEDEAARVRARGGRVEPVFDGQGRPVGPPRAWLANKDTPGLMVTRSLGDRVGKGIGVVAEPYKVTLANDLAFIVAASDGLWEVMTGADTVAFVANALSGKQENISEVLCVEARRRWIIQEGAVLDDVSCIVTVFKR